MIRINSLVRFIFVLTIITSGTVLWAGLDNYDNSGAIHSTATLTLGGSYQVDGWWNYHTSYMQIQFTPAVENIRKVGLVYYIGTGNPTGLDEANFDPVQTGSDIDEDFQNGWIEFNISGGPSDIQVWNNSDGLSSSSTYTMTVYSGENEIIIGDVNSQYNTTSERNGKRIYFALVYYIQGDGWELDNLTSCAALSDGGEEYHYLTFDEDRSTISDYKEYGTARNYGDNNEISSATYGISTERITFDLDGNIASHVVTWTKTSGDGPNKTSTAFLSADGSVTAASDIESVDLGDWLTDGTYYDIQFSVTEASGNTYTTSTYWHNNIKYDVTAPTVSLVYSEESNGATLSEGEIADFYVQFSEKINFNGAPQITLLKNDGVTASVTSDSYADWQNKAYFSWTVPDGAYSKYLDYENTGSLISGVYIKDIAYNDAVLTLPTPPAYGSQGTGNSLSGASTNGYFTVDGDDPTGINIASVTSFGGNIVSDYINGTNTGLRLTVSLNTTDETMDGGALAIQGNYNNAGWGDLGDDSGPAFTVTTDERQAGTKICDITVTGGLYSLDDLTGWAHDNSVQFRITPTDDNTNVGLTSIFATAFDIDLREPEVTSVTGEGGNTVARTLGISDSEDFEVNIVESTTGTAENVTVVTPGGGTAPTLKLETGSTDATAEFQSSSFGTSKLVFRYTVSNGETSAGNADGELITHAINPLSAGTSTIRDAAGNDLELDISGLSTANSLKNANITVDGIPPATFTTGIVTVTGGTVLTGYWNTTNTNVEIVVPIADDASLDGGRAQIQGKVGSNDFEDVGTYVDIASGDLNSTVTVTLNSTQFEGITGFTSGVTVSLTAVLTDDAGNSTTGNTSASTVAIDKIAPTVFTTGVATVTGGTVKSNYWNSTNTGVEIDVPIEDESSLTGGNIQMQVGVDGSYETIGSSITIDSDDLGTNQTVTLTSIQLEAHSDYVEGGIISFKAILTDVAGNYTAGNPSATTLTIDETAPTVTNVTSTNGTYMIGESVDIVVNFNDNIVTTGTPQLTLNTSNSPGNTNAVVDLSSLAGSALTFRYTVAEGEYSEDLNYNSTTSLALNSGTIRDAAGNDATLTLPATASENSIAVSYAVVIDGVSPLAFITGSVTVTGGTVVEGYWNNTNTNVSIIVPIANDVSLEGGVVQIQGKVGSNDYENVGTTTVIANDDLNSTVTVFLSDIEFEGITDFILGTTVSLTATQTDNAGNSTTGTASSTTIAMDQTLPPIYTTGTVTSVGGTVVSGVWNSHNTDVEIIVPLDNTDASLVGGTVQIQAHTNGSFEDLGTLKTISSDENTANSKTISLIADSLEGLTDYTDDDVITFRSIITDIAGNQRIGSPSSTTLTVDETPPAITEVSSDDDDTDPIGFGNTINLKIVFDDAVTVNTVSGTPQLTLKTDNAPGTTNSTADYTSGSGTVNLIFQYTVSPTDYSSDLNYEATTSLSLNSGTMRDASGNNATLTLPATDAAGALGQKKDFWIDGVAPATNTVGSVITVGAPVVSGYWNSGNTSVLVQVPLSATDVSLAGGMIQLQGEADGVYEDIGPLTTIVSDSVTAGTQTITVAGTGTADTDFEEITDLTDDDEVNIKAVVTDRAGNSVTYTQSVTALNIDQTARAVYTTGAVTGVGGTVVSGVWNSHNTDVEIIVPLDNTDASLVGGTVQIQAHTNGSFEDLGTLKTISSDENTANSKTISLIADSLEGLTDYTDDDVITFRSIITDIAGNQRIGSPSSTTLTVDETPPAITEVSSDDDDTDPIGFGNTINLKIVFDDAVTVNTVSGTPQLTLKTDNAPGTTNSTADYTSGSGTVNLIFQYTVSPTDYSSDLNYEATTSLSLNSGTMRDASGNNATLTLPATDAAGALGQKKDFWIDGVAPATNTVGSVITVGAPVVSGYWNSGNTSVLVQVPLSATDVSLAGGMIQLQGEADGVYEDIGPLTTIVSDSVTAGTQTITVAGTGTADTDFEEITDLTDDDEVNIKAVVTDRAGNSVTYTQSVTALNIDQTAPTIQVVGDVITTGGRPTNNYWNGSNDGANIIIPLENSDLSLTDGSIRLEARAGNNSWAYIGELFSITDLDRLNASKTVWTDAGGTDSTDIRELPGFANDLSLQFRATVTDVAGNSADWTVSDSTLLIDEEVPTVASVSSTLVDGYYTIGQLIPITVSFNEVVIVTITGTPTILLETGSSDGTGYFTSGDSTNLLTFDYTVLPGHNNDTLDYVASNSLALNGGSFFDVAGNAAVLTLAAPGDLGSLAANKNISVDTQAPEVYITLSDSLVKQGDLCHLVADFSEIMTAAPEEPELYILFAGGDYIDTTDMNFNAGVTWTFEPEIPDTNDGTALISIIGTDRAGNSLTDLNTYGRNLLRLDNTDPAFTDFNIASGAYINHRRFGWTLTETSGRLESGTIFWDQVGGIVNDVTTNLSWNELLSGPKSESDLNDPPALVNSITYDIIFTAIDSAGNVGRDTILAVTYDITPPAVNLSYSHYQVAADTVVNISALFSEKIPVDPPIQISFNNGAGLTENGTMTAVGNDSINFSYPLTIPTGTSNEGVAVITLTATDLANNALTTDSTFFRDTLLIDSSPVTVNFEYSNLTQTHLTDLGRVGDIIEITARFNDQMRISSEAPVLDIQYADSTDDSIEGWTYTTKTDGDSTWIYEITLPAGTENSDTITVFASGQDLAGNAIEAHIDDEIFIVDNTPPAAFATGAVTTVAGNIVNGWINGSNDSLEIKVPVLIADLSGTVLLSFAVPAKMDTASIWAIAGDPIDLTRAANQDSFYADIDTIIMALNNAMIGDLEQGDTILTKVIKYDQVGNNILGRVSVQKLVYDVRLPVAGTPITWNGTSPDTLVSDDSLHLVWGAYSEPSPTSASGIERYEWAVETGGPGWTEFMGWTSVSADTSIDTALALTHANIYRLKLRAFDVAGNQSVPDQITTSFLRQNSAPEIAAVDSTIVYEDVEYADTIIVSDPDLATLNGDEFTYQLLSAHREGWPPVTPATIDTTGIIFWQPAPQDTGIYDFTVYVNDNWGFSDDLSFVVNALPVNDVPVAAFRDTTIVLVEDSLRTTQVYLNPFVTDEDNLISELDWYRVVILDTVNNPGYPEIGYNYPPDDATDDQIAMLKINSGQVIADPSDYETLAAEWASNPPLTVDIVKSNDSTIAIITADTNYFGKMHRIIFYVRDPDVATDNDTILLVVESRNDPPVLSVIPDQDILENDSLLIDLGEFAYDVDDSTLTFTIVALTNPDSLSISQSQYLSSSLGDTIVFTPKALWSDSALIHVIISDDSDAADTVQFVLDIIRVQRPHLSIAVVQNSAFANHFEIIVNDTLEKTIHCDVTVDGTTINLDTVTAYTYIGRTTFTESATFTVSAYAQGIVGDTAITRTGAVVLARSRGHWTGSSPDGLFQVTGEMGTVPVDQLVLVIDSTLFEYQRMGRAAYRLGAIGMNFKKPVLLSFTNASDKLALYYSADGAFWQELATMTVADRLLAWSAKMGYFKTGPRTLFVPEETALRPNYPNPFNPVTIIEYDIGFLDGPQQKVNIVVFDLLGRQVVELFDGHQTIGRHAIRWDSRNARGVPSASGVYFVRMMAGKQFVKTQKIMLLR